ncbi:MAG TPA: hypothetical protein VFS05_06075 [Gemmatimonadaceae bacterium]|nr:hypothetical protein [Gemmatimonadaceae bacterium]
MRVAPRLFLTVWLVYVLHFATNVVRETYLAIALGDHLSVRVDEFVGLHPDLFEVPGRGAYINNNPGASMLGALPYLAARPVIAGILRAKPELARPKQSATYDDPRPNRTKFLNEARARGLDVKLALAAAAMHAGLMAPLGALAAVVVFLFLRARLGSERRALWLALLYAFGTPIFFRSAFLNQNALVAHCVLFAYVLLAWPRARRAPATSAGADAEPIAAGAGAGVGPNAAGAAAWGPPPDFDDATATASTPHHTTASAITAFPGARALVGAGALLGLALLCDYSGAPLVLAFGIWALALGWRRGGIAGAVRGGALFTLGALGPILVLWGYQWAAFGNPFFPAQRYMPATEYSVHGWNGMTWPLPKLLLGNLLDPRYGLLAFCPMLAAAVVAPFLARRPGGPTRGELALIFGATIALLLFNSSILFALLQWNTGVRYMVPAVPLLFFALVPVLLRLPEWAMWALVVPTVAVSWSVAMAREAVPISLERIFLRGFELPWLHVLEVTSGAYAPFLRYGSSPVPLFCLTGVVLWLLWRRARVAA